MLTVYEADFGDQYTAEAYIRSRWPYTKLRSDWSAKSAHEVLAKLITRSGRAIYYTEGGTHKNDFWQQWQDEEAFKRYEEERMRRDREREARGMLDELTLVGLTLEKLEIKGGEAKFSFKGESVKAEICLNLKQ